MLNTLYHALMEDYHHYETDRDVHTEEYVDQLRNRVASMRKTQPEYTALQKSWLPELRQTGKLDDTHKQNICLRYWSHARWDFSPDPVDTEPYEDLPESAMTLMHERVRGRLLNDYINRASDAVFMGSLSDPDTETAVTSRNDARLVTQELAKKSIVSGLHYQLHLLESQLMQMMARHQDNIEYEGQAGTETIIGAVHATDFRNSNRNKKTIIASEARQVDRTTFNMEASGDGGDTEAKSDFIAPIDVSDSSVEEPIDIWYSLAENPETPYQFLVWLSENHNPYVSQRAMQTLKKFERLNKRA